MVVRGAAGNLELDKSKTTSRIDGVVAIAMALGVAQSEVKAEPHHQDVFRRRRAVGHIGAFRAKLLTDGDGPHLNEGEPLSLRVAALVWHRLSGSGLNGIAEHVRGRFRPILAQGA